MIDCGVEFTAAGDNISVTTATQCLVQLTASSTVPCLIKKLVATSNQTASTLLQVRLARLSAAGTGGTAVTPNATSAQSSITATATVLSLCTLGTSSFIYDAQQWNEFAPYAFNLIPSGLLVPPSATIALQIPVAPGAGFVASYTLVYQEIR
jgi:hypothetical protein